MATLVNEEGIKLVEMDEPIIFDEGVARTDLYFESDQFEDDIYIVQEEEDGQNYFRFAYIVTHGLMVSVEDENLYRRLIDWLEEYYMETD